MKSLVLPKNSRRHLVKHGNDLRKCLELVPTTDLRIEIVLKKVITPATVKAVEEPCVTCGGAHAYYNYPNTDSNQSNVCAAMGTYNQVAPPNRVSNHMAPPGFAPVQNSQNRKYRSNPTSGYPISLLESDILTTLPKTTPIPEPDIPKNLPKPNIPYPSRRNDQKSRDKASNQMEKIFQIFQDLRFDISFADALLLMPRFAPTIKSLLMNKDKLLELAKIPLNENCSAILLKKLPEKLGDPGKFLYHATRYSSTYDDSSINRIDVIDVACEEFSQEVLGFLNSSSGGNPTSSSDPIISSTTPSFILFEGGDIILEELETFLQTSDELTDLDDDFYDTEGDILYLKQFFNEDPSPSLTPKKNEDLKEVTKEKPLIEEPLEL
ncbi:hypothetical protein Tco_0953541 [Tanacetum coccineum]|uniref:Reverse transcriptase domain-containing protein n=1 Tax=Tanacetum coccineum TaxID=301880 RepID=A0ABQ5E066_9ASTR